MECTSHLRDVLISESDLRREPEETRLFHQNQFSIHLGKYCCIQVWPSIVAVVVNFQQSLNKFTIIVNTN